jgi:hypothetical protein
LGLGLGIRLGTLDALWASGSAETIYNFVRYFGLYPEAITSMADITAVFNPYMYGFVPEISGSSDPKNTKMSVVKHMTLGRKAYELAYVLPDRRTVYGTDDGAAGILTMFVADTAGDLSAGTLYGSKFTLTSSADFYAAGEYSMEWISFGRASPLASFSATSSAPSPPTVPPTLLPAAPRATRPCGPWATSA